MFTFERKLSIAWDRKAVMNMAPSSTLKIVEDFYASAGIARALLTIPWAIKIPITHMSHIDGIAFLT